MGDRLAHQFDAACLEISPLCSGFLRVSVGLFVGCVCCSLCGTRWVSFPVQSVPSRELLCGTGSFMPEKEDYVKQDKNLQFCVDCLRSMQERDELEPEQRGALEKAKVRLKRLRRNPNPTRREIFEAVREVAEAIINNFVHRD